MTETLGYVPENKEKVQESQKGWSRFNRRVLLKGTAAAAGVVGTGMALGYAGKEAFNTLNASSEKPAPTPASEQLIEFSREFVGEIDHVTADHLTGVYQERMDTEVFEGMPGKQKFMEEVTQVAADLDPDHTNDNLANQLAAAFSYFTRDSFAKNIYDDSPGDERLGPSGLLPLSSDLLKTYGYSNETFQTENPHAQLGLVRDILLKRKEQAGATFEGYFDIGHILTAIIQPSVMTANSEAELYTQGTDAYTKYKMFDVDNDGDVTIDNISETIKNTVLANHNEHSDFLVDPRKKYS